MTLVVEVSRTRRFRFVGNNVTQQREEARFTRAGPLPYPSYMQLEALYFLSLCCCACVLHSLAKKFERAGHLLSTNSASGAVVCIHVPA